ncbi:MAG: hypothetical protein FWH52_06510, partial [Synergistaceae bacterium]|nr:hypothetical protein [Synergistaceae bacterium]
MKNLKNKFLPFVTIFAILTTMFTVLLAPVAVEAASLATYDNLYAAVQGETNATAAYTAFAEKAIEEGYPVIGRLFVATSEAEAKHAEDEWNILVSMGAKNRPVAAAPAVGTTADNLQAAFGGETYEYQTMYPGFLATAQAENQAGAERIFNLAGQAEKVHAGNYADVLANLANYSYIEATYGTIYRCPVCGEIVTGRPGRCPICGAGGEIFVMYNETYFNLYASVQGETNASASYIAFSAVAKAEGNFVVARLFAATSDAEAKHAADEWEILQSMGATKRPVVGVLNVGTTADNLQAAFNGETYEYQTMYPNFKAAADAEGMVAASRIFNMAGQA